MARHQKDLLKAADVGARMGLTTNRVYQLVADGTLPSVRLGRSIFIPSREFSAWLRERGQTPVPVTLQGASDDAA